MITGQPEMLWAHVMLKVWLALQDTEHKPMFPWATLSMKLCKKWQNYMQHWSANEQYAIKVLLIINATKYYWKTNDSTISH
jgi:hypothetical protein